MTDSRPLKVHVHRIPEEEGTIKMSITLAFDPADRESRQQVYDKIGQVFAVVVPPEERQQVLDEFQAAAVLAVAAEPVTGSHERKGRK